MQLRLTSQALSSMRAKDKVRVLVRGGNGIAGSSTVRFLSKDPKIEVVSEDKRAPTESQAVYGLREFGYKIMDSLEAAETLEPSAEVYVSLNSKAKEPSQPKKPISSGTGQDYIKDDQVVTVTTHKQIVKNLLDGLPQSQLITPENTAHDPDKFDVVIDATGSAGINSVHSTPIKESIPMLAALVKIMSPEIELKEFRNCVHEFLKSDWVSGNSGASLLACKDENSFWVIVPFDKDKEDMRYRFRDETSVPVQNMYQEEIAKAFTKHINQLCAAKGQATDNKFDTVDLQITNAFGKEEIKSFSFQPTILPSSVDIEEGGRLNFKLGCERVRVHPASGQGASNALQDAKEAAEIILSVVRDPNLDEIGFHVKLDEFEARTKERTQILTEDAIKFADGDYRPTAPKLRRQLTDTLDQ